MELSLKRNLYRNLCIELYGYNPYCNHTIKDYENMIFTYFHNKKDAVIFINRNI